MTELDPKLRALLTRTNTALGPPRGVEARMFAGFEARLEEGPGQGPEPGAQGDEGLGPGGEGLTAKLTASTHPLMHGLKVVAAVLGLSAAGVGVLWAGGQVMRSQDPIEREPLAAVQSEPRASLTVGEGDGGDAPGGGDGGDALGGGEASLDRSILGPEPGPSARAATKADRPASVHGEEGIESPPRPVSAATLAAQLQLIRAARVAPPVQALELLDQHAEQFPTGEFSAERETLRLIALCTLGELERAADARQRFVAARPGSLLRDKARKACAGLVELGED